MAEYEKPLVRDLGNIFPLSEGACAAGSTVIAVNQATCVGGIGANNANNGCKPGSQASGAGCLTGIAPYTGQLPDCRNGFIAYA